MGNMEENMEENMGEHGRSKCACVCACASYHIQLQAVPGCAHTLASLAIERCRSNIGDVCVCGTGSTGPQSRRLFLPCVPVFRPCIADSCKELAPREVLKRLLMLKDDEKEQLGIEAELVD